MRKQFADVTPAQRETLEEGFETMRARFTEMEKGEAGSSSRRRSRTQRPRRCAARQAAMKELERYPADPRALVAIALRQFLDLSKDIDFTAQLVERDKKMRFADAALEASPPSGKCCFGPEKPATDAARAFAQKWLADLEAKGVK